MSEYRAFVAKQTLPAISACSAESWRWGRVFHVICLDKSETAIRRLFRHRFADDDFEVLLLVFPLPYVTAVDAYRQRRPRTR